MLSWVDWIFVLLFFVVTLGVGVAVAKKASSSEAEYFLGGRTMPWWLLGFSMVATTFSTDTPNLVTDLVRSNGIAGNWIWWSSLVGGMMGVFIFARLWRRTGAVTDLEVYEMRYSGRGAAILRGYRSIYVGILSNIMTMSAVTLAAMKIGGVMLGLTPMESVVYAMVVTVAFSSVGGFRGVIYTDFILFGMAMLGAFAAAWFALSMPEVGGFSNLVAKLEEHPELRQRLAIMPTSLPKETFFTIFILPFFLLWWCGDQGGGYIVQRMLAAKSEKHALGAVLFFNVMHYVVRPWPWIIVALASLLIFPSDSDEARLAAKQELKLIQSGDRAALARIPADEAGRAPYLRKLTAAGQGVSSLADRIDARYVPDDKLGHDMAYSAMLMKLPRGWLGFVLASLIAAYMSTISTHLNWGASYIVNDFYNRFLRPEASGRELVWVGRLSTVLLMVLSTLLAFCLQSAMNALMLFMTLGAGMGVIMLLRWFWWRINAWAELTVIIAAMPVTLYFQYGHNRLFPEHPVEFYQAIALSILVTNILGFAVLLFTPPTDRERLKKFYRDIHPGGPGWKPIAAELEAEGVTVESDGKKHLLPLGVLGMVLGMMTIYSSLFAIGGFILGNPGQGVLLTIIAAAGTAGLLSLWPKLNR